MLVRLMYASRAVDADAEAIAAIVKQSRAHNGAVGITGLLGSWLARTPRGDWKTALPYALVIGGAIGNVIDRLIHGHVVDFIQWYWRGYYWPAFNLADSAIVAGAVGIALFGLFAGKSAAGKAPRRAGE